MPFASPPTTRDARARSSSSSVSPALPAASPPDALLIARPPPYYCVLRPRAGGQQRRVALPAPGQHAERLRRRTAQEAQRGLCAAQQGAGAYTLGANCSSAQLYE